MKIVGVQTPSMGTRVLGRRRRVNSPSPTTYGVASAPLRNSSCFCRPRSGGSCWSRTTTARSIGCLRCDISLLPKTALIKLFKEVRQGSIRMTVPPLGPAPELRLDETVLGDLVQTVENIPKPTRPKTILVFAVEGHEAIRKSDDPTSAVGYLDCSQRLSPSFRMSL